jgi:hypothetical protein
VALETLSQNLAYTFSLSLWVSRIFRLSNFVQSKRASQLNVKAIFRQRIGSIRTCSKCPVPADCVEKLVGFSLSKWVIALILLGRLYVDHDVSLWRAPTA